MEIAAGRRTSVSRVPSLGRAASESFGPTPPHSADRDSNGRLQSAYISRKSFRSGLPPARSGSSPTLNLTTDFWERSQRSASSRCLQFARNLQSKLYHYSV